MFRRFRLIALALPIAAGCYSNETLDPPDLSNNNGLFTRFVAIGTSISSGLQSAGINDSTQQRAFPVLVAQQAGASFFRPSLNLPGCPAPYVNNITQARVGGPGAPACSLRTTPIPHQVGNLAVPGLTAPDLFTNTGSELSTYERLQTFFLGGQTPWNAVRNAQPTLLSIEIGSSDVIGAVSSAGNPGNPDSVTTIAAFTTNFALFADSVETLNTEVVVFTVPDVTQIPFTSRGSTYWCLKTGLCGIPAAPFPANYTVANNCAPAAAIPGSKGDSILVPWTIGYAALLRASAPPPAPPAPFNLDCSNDQLVVTPAEYANVRNTTVAINALIRSEAAARGWAVVDAGAIFTQLQTQAGGVPLFPISPSVATGGSVGFGAWFSLDGFHPSSATHQVIADSMIAVINRSFTTQIPALP
jgi:lysophospholipase L1-like esterase